MDPRKPSNDEKDFVRVAKIAMAVGLGLMAAFLYSLKRVHPAIELKLTLGTLLVFIVTVAGSWAFGALLFKDELGGDGSLPAADARRQQVKRALTYFLIIFGLATLGAFLYSLKDVSADGRREVLEGTGLAVLVLSIGGVLIHQAVKFFEAQDRASLQRPPEDEDADR